MRVWIAAFILCVCTSSVLAQTKKPKSSPNDAEKPKPKLAVIEFAGTTELKLTGLQPLDVSIPLTIENRDKTPILNIKVSLTRFFGSGRTADAQLDAPPFDLAAGAQKLLQLTAKFPVAATYKAQLRVDAGAETVFSGTIVVERKYAKAPLEFGSVPAKLVTTLCPFDVSFEPKIQTTGDTVTLDPPELQSITLKEKPSATIGVAAPRASLKVDPPFDKPFIVDHTQQKLKLTLTDLRKAGVYEAQVRFGGEGYQGTILPLTVYVREPWWVLLLVIALGIGVSFFLRTYTSVLRPRLLNERRVATLYSELDEHARVAGADAAAISVVQHIRRLLTVYYNDLSAAATLTDPTSFDIYDLKIDLLPQWITLRKRVALLKPETLRKPFEDRLQAAQKTLIDSASDAAKVRTQISDLEAMPVDIDAKIKEELGAQLTAFRTELANDPRDAVKAIVEAIVEVDAHLTHNRLADAATGLDALQRRYIRLLADELSARLSSTPPIGVAEREWPATLSTITAGLAHARTAPTAAAATEAFRSSLTLFLNSALAGLRMHLQERVKNAKKPEVYKNVETLVDEVAARIAAGDLLAAWKKLADTEAAYRAVIEATTSGTMGPELKTPLDALATMAAPASTAGDAFNAIAAIFGAGTSSDVLQQKGTMVTIEESIRRRDIVVTIIILLIAVAIGFKALWVDNLTWGGWMAYLIAFLWGVGFDQFGHAGLVATIKS